MDIITLILAITAVSLSIYFYFNWKYSYWSRIGLDYLEPLYFFGNTINLCKGVSMGDTFTELYKEMKSRGYKHGGLYFFCKPIYMPVHLDMVKNVLQTGFDHFVNHGIYFDEETEPLTAHLFSLENEKWKNLRKKLSPAFTSVKIKMMFSTVFKCSSTIVDILETHAKHQDAINIKDVLMRFSIDVIGSVAFGLNCNSLKENNSKFLEIARRIFDSVAMWERCKEAAIFLFPKRFLRAVSFKFMNQDVEDFFFNIVGDTIKYRETNHVYRKDFMHLLIQLKNRGKITNDTWITLQDGEELGEDTISFNELVAQCFVFFAAGFETSASTLSFTLLELALNEDVQEKLRTEIEMVLDKHNDELSYESIMEMTYLDQVIHEALRMHPPGPLLPRMCNKDYQVPGTNVVIKEGTRVVIPAIAIQNDPDIYPNPERFDPDRWSSQNKAERHNFSFLPFGGGPRHCIGARFGMLEVKVAVAMILRNFRLHTHEKMKLPIQYGYNNAFILVVKGGIWLKVSKLK